MRKYGKWALTLGLIAATPGLGVAAPWSRTKNADQAAETAPEKTAPAKATNQQMADKIAVALRDAKLQGYDIGIEYKNGTATLTGRVTDPKQKEKATQVVEKLAGITRVDNQLILTTKPAVADRARQGAVQQAGMQSEGPQTRRVQPVNFQPAGGPAPAVESSSGANQSKAEEIAAALTAAQLDGYDIEIRYQDGVALLGGSVGTMAEREAADRVVRQIPGVMSVQNLLRPTQEPMAPMMGPQGPMMGPQGPMMGPQGPIHPAAYQGGMPGAPMPVAPGMGVPGYGHGGPGASPAVFNSPSLPDHAWPAYAQYPNYAAVTYPQQYSASAFPYIGPFYPYPQVPLGWRDATLRWDDGQWNLQFRQRTDKWWWFLSPKNW